ncbi:MAG: helix-turn-helix domain-containing protein [Fischerella sp.]|nr:helix-turn-helix domain-containing protein [Fischerella sp.]
MWSFDDPPDEDAVKALVKRLRQKLKAAGAPDDFVATAYGMGYYLKQYWQQRQPRHDQNPTHRRLVAMKKPGQDI